MTSKPTQPEARLYPITWDEVKEAELDDALRATPAQRLAWLEDAMKFVWAAGRARALIWAKQTPSPDSSAPD